MSEKRIPRSSDRLTDEEHAQIQRAVDLMAKGPDFSKLKCEQPLPDTAVVLQRI